MKLFSEFLDNRVKGREKNLPIFFYEKEASYDFFLANNIPTVQKIKIYDNPEQINFDELPYKFVLKPSFLSSTLGVMLLEKIDDLYYWDSFLKRKLSKEQVIEIQNKFFNSSAAKVKKIVVEELILDSLGYQIPLDYKVFVFGNKIGGMGVYNRNLRNQILCDWYDSNLELSTTLVKTNAPHTFNTPKPHTIANKKEIIDFAIQVNSKINLPFVSLDIYSTLEGLKLGEVTLRPGGVYYQKMLTVPLETDKYWGELWEYALHSQIS